MRRSLLKRFIAQTLTTPKVVLASCYRSENDVAQAIGIQQEDPHFYEKVSSELLQQLHTKLRKSRVEKFIWPCLVWHLKNALPSEVAHDLLDRKIAVNELGHSRQNEDVQWRMAMFYDEALLTLAKDRYCSRKYDLSEFRRVLDFNSTHDWMMSFLSHAPASSKAKEQLFLDTAKRHPDAEKLIETHEAMATGRREAKEEQKVYAQLLVLAAKPEITDDEALELLQITDQELYETLIKNRQLSTAILQEMTQLKNFGGASQVRGAAKSELNRRRQIGEREKIETNKTQL